MKSSKQSTFSVIFVSNRWCSIKNNVYWWTCQQETLSGSSICLQRTSWSRSRASVSAGAVLLHKMSLWSQQRRCSLLCDKKLFNSQWYSVTWPVFHPPLPQLRDVVMSNIPWSALIRIHLLLSSLSLLPPAQSRWWSDEDSRIITIKWREYPIFRLPSSHLTAASISLWLRFPFSVL